MSTMWKIKLKSHRGIAAALQFGVEFVRDLWRQVLAEREVRIRLMTEGHLDQR